MSEALRLIDGALRPARFDPTRDERVYRIAASEYETALIVPRLVGKGLGAARFVARKKHPVMAQAMDIGACSSYGHALVSPGGTLTGIVDKALASAGVSRRVVVAVPYFLAALATVADTDLIATVPRRVAHCHARQFGLAEATPPIPVRSFPVQMIWSRRLAAD